MQISLKVKDEETVHAFLAMINKVLSLKEDEVFKLSNYVVNNFGLLSTYINNL